ncbi:MAG: glycosyltransferase, partial [Planctomycetota bacterium]
VDIVILSRDREDLDARVVRGLREQVDVRVRVHRLVGQRRADDPHRWETIARARNRARDLGDSKWIMFLDDDVRLAPHAISNLVQGLRDRPAHAALAANFLQERPGERPARHVAMGATLFRRKALRQVTFRWQDKQCECLCCCQDLRQLGWEIDYLDAACAFHLRKDAEVVPDRNSRVPLAGRVLVAFNRRHLAKFRSHFLRTLRGHGNREQVTAVVYGLYPSELRQLRTCHGVEVVPLPVNGVMPPIRRLTDFQHVIQSWPDDTPVAYWDAGDVVFQSRLEGLWQLARQHRHKLLAVREPRGYPDNAAVTGWTQSIADPLARRSAFELFSQNPFLNSGFAAGTAVAMRRYFKTAARLRDSAALAGTTDWGDQTALNLYCHSNSDGWVEIDEGWNYCLHDRHRGEVVVRPDGRLASRRGTPIYAAHGNARSLYKLELSHVVGG